MINGGRVQVNNISINEWNEEDREWVRYAERVTAQTLGRVAQVEHADVRVAIQPLDIVEQSRRVLGRAYINGVGPGSNYLREKLQGLQDAEQGRTSADMRIRLRLPEVAYTDEENYQKRRFRQVVMHEVTHTLGWESRDSIFKERTVSQLRPDWDRMNVGMTALWVFGAVFNVGLLALCAVKYFLAFSEGEGVGTLLGWLAGGVVSIITLFVTQVLFVKFGLDYYYGYFFQLPEGRMIQLQGWGRGDIAANIHMPEGTSEGIMIPVADVRDVLDWSEDEKAILRALGYTVIRDAEGDVI